ncbi:MAG TPA: site-specific DNA-methyltransferase [Dehalococcoidia bacterium]|nr:site-specific DNA-methyltransferase [Dehalococcoidia bacterium]
MSEPYYQDKWVTIYHGDCREILPQLDMKVDLVVTDPPYGVTQNKQDKVVDLSRIIIYPTVIFSQQPYTTQLINRYEKLFRYDLIWDKVLTSGFLNANKMPLRRHEVILVFGDVRYKPIKVMGEKSHSKGKPKENRNENYGAYNFVDNTDELGYLKHPTSILRYEKPHPSIALHRTEKPTELISWLLESYSMPDNLILDPFLGSGTTCYCAKALNRYSIGIEIEEKYCEIAAKRCSQEVMELRV